jgi:hypothetical protein
MLAAANSIHASEFESKAQAGRTLSSIRAAITSEGNSLPLAQFDPQEPLSIRPSTDHLLACHHDPPCSPDSQTASSTAPLDASSKKTPNRRLGNVSSVQQFCRLSHIAHIQFGCKSFPD